MRQHESRLRNAQQKVKPYTGVMYRCHFSDGSIEDLNIMQAMNRCSQDGEDDFKVIEPYIVGYERFGRDKEYSGYRLCSVAEQMMDGIIEKAARGEIHR